VFAAIVALTYVRSNDQSFALSTPSTGFNCPALSYPMPVMDKAGTHIGDIEVASVVDHRIVAFGHFFHTQDAERAVTKLVNVTARLEIDITGGTRTTCVDLETGKPYDVVSGWSLMSATVGSRPAWNLPPVQIEELTR
jgi:hypothetical protein